MHCGGGGWWCVRIGYTCFCVLAATSDRGAVYHQGQVPMFEIGVPDHCKDIIAICMDLFVVGP